MGEARTFINVLGGQTSWREAVSANIGEKFYQKFPLDGRLAAVQFATDSKVAFNYPDRSGYNQIRGELSQMLDSNLGTSTLMDYAFDDVTRF